MTDREEFESAIAESPYRPPADKNGGLYKSIIAEAMWWAWQASRVAADKRIEELGNLALRALVELTMQSIPHTRRRDVLISDIRSQMRARLVGGGE